MKIFTGDAARGLERCLKLHGINKSHLDFDGKVSRLSQDPTIESISGSIFDSPRGSIFDSPRRAYNIVLRKNLTREEILSLVSKYGFAKPVDVTGTENMQCTEHPLYTELTFPDPHQCILFVQPSKTK